MIWFGVGVAVLTAAILGGVLGFGTATLLLPILTIAFGIRVAVPVLGVAMVFSCGSRAALSWRDIDWKVVRAYSIAGVPAALVGASAYVGVNTRSMNIAIAAFVLLVVPARIIAERVKLVMKLGWFTPLGAVVGVVSGAGGAVGPAGTPFYLSYGLVGPGYLGTDGFNTTLVHGSKSVLYWFSGSMRVQDATTGLLLGILMVIGSFIGRRIVQKVEPGLYVKAVEVCVMGLGCYMLFDSIRRAIY